VSLEQVVFHVDVDAFYASVEQRDDPELRGRPVIVGAAPGHRGVVSACSYEAREFGVHSAMPISEAFSRCPQGVFLPVRMHRYQEVSQEVMAILRDAAPEFQQISVDEAFLDMSGTERLLGSPEEVAATVKSRVLDRVGLTISIGIAFNRYLAKLASEFEKPDGLVRVRRGDELAFVDGLELGDLWGVGQSTLARLHAMGVYTIPQLRARTREELVTGLGEAGSGYLYRACRGLDPGILSPQPRSRSVSSEVTFGGDTTDAEHIHLTLLGLAEQLVQRLIAEGLQSRVVRLKMRFADFTTTTAQRAAERPIRSANEVMSIAGGLLGSRWNGITPIRLIGLGFGDVSARGDTVQRELFEDRHERAARVERTVSKIKSKIGRDAITKASLIGHRSRDTSEASPS
jgi:DNA polymerase-4